MAQRPHPQDAYGRPLPTLTDADRAVLKARPFNVLQRRRIAAVLEDLYDALLRREIYAEVTVTFTIQSGIIQAEVSTGVSRQHRFAQEDA
jgi:hypothetical protein